MYTNDDLVGLGNDYGFIRVYNSGGFVTRIVGSYYLNGRLIIKQNPDFLVGTSSMLIIPANAIDVRFGVYIAIYFETWLGIYSRKFSKVPRKCFNVTGTTWRANCYEVTCPGDNDSNGNKPCCCCCNCSC